jgi:hypothetical protein
MRSKKNTREGNERGQDGFYRGSRRECSATSGGQVGDNGRGFDDLGFDRTTIARTRG